MNIKKVFRFITIFIMVFYNFLGSYDFIPNSFKSLILVIPFVSTLCLIFSEKYKRKDFNKMILLFIIISLLYIITKNTNLLFLVIISMIYYNGDKKELAKYFFIALTINFISVIGLNFLNVIPSHNLSRNGQIRYSLGFIHPNSVFLYYFFICCSLFYISNNNKIKLITFPIALILYKYSLCRTGIVCYTILLLLTFIKLDKINWKKLIVTGYLFFTIFTIISTFLYSKNQFQILNAIFSDRLYNYNYYINNGLLFKPFGMLNDSLSDLYTIDNLYLIIFYNYGFIGFIILSFGLFKSLKNIATDTIFDQNTFFKIVFSCLIYGVCESNIILTNINFTLPILTLYLLNFREVKKSE